MARILSIDYGKKRTGLAVTDSLQIIANGLATVSTSSLIDYLKDYIAKEPVERIVIGSRTADPAKTLYVWSSLSIAGVSSCQTSP